MQEQKNYLIYGAIGIALLLFLASLYYGLNRPANPSQDTGINATSTGVTSSGNDVQVTGSGSVTIGEGEEVDAPNFRKPLTFGATISPEVRNALNAQLEATIDALEIDSLNFSAWNNLAVVRKMAGDYSGAEEVWLYTAVVFSESTIPFNNLGVLYLDFIKNYPKAEANFKQALKINPGDINAYQQLFALYTVYGYKAGTSAAADLIAQGLRANPGNQTLLQLQAQLQ